MLDLIAWLGVYTLVLLALGRLARPWRERTWFKVLFFPGTILAAGVQVVAALLSVAGGARISPVGDKAPVFRFDQAKVPCLAGALFILLAHAFLYVIYLVAAAQVESAGLSNLHWLSLPRLYPEKIVEGHVDFDFRGYLAGLDAFFAASAARPLVPLLFLYVAAGAFASMRIERREAVWALILFAAAAALTWLARWFGVSFSFLSRGWWAGFSYFPDWWALFSLYVTLSGLSLAGFGIPRVLQRLVHGLTRPSEERKDSSKKSDRKKVAVEA